MILGVAKVMDVICPVFFPLILKMISDSCSWSRIPLR